MLCLIRRVKDLDFYAKYIEDFAEVLSDSLDKDIIVERDKDLKFLPKNLIKFTSEADVFVIAATSKNNNIVITYDGNISVYDSVGSKKRSLKADLSMYDFDSYDIVGIDDENCYQYTIGNITILPLFNYLYRTTDGVVRDSSGNILEDFKVDKIYTPYEAKLEVLGRC